MKISLLLFSCPLAFFDGENILVAAAVIVIVIGSNPLHLRFFQPSRRLRALLFS